MRCFCVLAGVPDPWCEKWETLYVTRVEMTDTATVLSIVACGMEGDGVTLGSDREEGSRTYTFTEYHKAANN